MILSRGSLLGNPVRGSPTINPTRYCCPFQVVLFTSAYMQVASRWAAKYVLPIAQRLGDLVPGINISVNDARGALYACPFDLAARIQSPWCNVFSKHELQNLE